MTPSESSVSRQSSSRMGLDSDAGKLRLRGAIDWSSEAGWVVWVIFESLSDFRYLNIKVSRRGVHVVKRRYFDRDTMYLYLTDSRTVEGKCALWEIARGID